MAHKSNRKARKLPDEAEQDFAAPADQWIDQDWHLPPGGDHSWREREVQRIFGGVVEEPINDKADPPPLEQIGPTSDEMDGSYEPGFRRGGALNVLLAVPLAACVVLFIVAISVPQILTPSFWRSRGPAALSDTPVRAIDGAVAAENVTPRLAYGAGSKHDSDKVVSQALPQPAERVVAPAKVYRKTALPGSNPPASIATGQERQSGTPAVRVAKAHAPLQAKHLRKLAANPLPPIGEAYFASHAPAAAAGKVLRPIGEAYFASHSPAPAD